MSRCLVDEHIPAALIRSLRVAGIDVQTPREAGLASADDPELAAHALQQQRWVISNDSDFLDLASDAGLSGSPFPSLIFWPQQSGRGIGFLSGEIIAILRSSTASDAIGLVIYL